MDTAEFDEHRIASLPAYEELQHTRSHLVKLCAASCIAPFAVYIFLVVFYPAALLSKVFEGGSLTVGLVFALVLLLLCWAVTGFYVRVANGRLDALRYAILAKAGPAPQTPALRRDLGKEHLSEAEA